ncbi:hypothetical protein Dimus_037862 [Dionaea muscipula]
MISFAAWNVRGLNLVPRQREVRDLCAREGIVLCGLLETKVTEPSSRRVFERLFRGWAMVHNYSYDLTGTIWVCWNPTFVSVSPIFVSDQIIYCEVCLLARDVVFKASFVYARNEYSLRTVLWDSIQSHFG